MVRVFETKNGILHKYYPQYNSAEEARRFFSDEIKFVDAPDWCFEGYGYLEQEQGDARFIRPELPDGFVYDQYGNPTSPESYRKCERDIMLETADKDMFIALNHAYDGDTSRDWSGLVAQLRQFKIDVEATVNQQGYPEEVTYPQYPIQSEDE